MVQTPLYDLPFVICHGFIEIHDEYWLFIQKSNLDIMMRIRSGIGHSTNRTSGTPTSISPTISPQSGLELHVLIPVTLSVALEGSCEFPKQYESSKSMNKHGYHCKSICPREIIKIRKLDPIPPKTLTTENGNG